jgi:NADPH-ferrihemoprotein reductase
MVAVLPQYMSSPEEKARCEALLPMTPEAKALYRDYVTVPMRTMLDILFDFPSCRIPFEHFVDVCPPLQPRYYSISSSGKEHQNEVTITAVVTRFQTPANRLHLGVCTTWLETLVPSVVQEATAMVWVRKSNFHLPLDPAVPIIMVGPGTGLAPFRGFLQDRVRQKNNANIAKVGEAVLFFGCRHPEHDYLYREELEAMAATGILKLHACFSRVPGQPKEYVTQRLVQPAVIKEIFPLLDAGAYFYVCGEAQHMASDVNKALYTIVSQGGGLDDTATAAYVKSMEQKGRYLKDVW